MLEGLGKPRLAQAVEIAVLQVATKRAKHRCDTSHGKIGLQRGYSFGGRVAYVMAQQLRAANQEVGILALFDTSSHVGQRRVGIQQWLVRHCERIVKMRLSDMPAYAVRSICNLAVMVYMLLRLKLFSAAWGLFETRNRPIPRFLRRPVEANDMIRRDYRARPYYGSAVLFKAELYAWSHPDSHEGWHKIVKGGLEIRPIPGRHFEIMKEPHVRSLSAELALCLEERHARYAAEFKRLVAEF